MPSKAVFYSCLFIFPELILLIRILVKHYNVSSTQSCLVSNDVILMLFVILISTDLYIVETEGKPDIRNIVASVHTV